MAGKHMSVVNGSLANPSSDAGKQQPPVFPGSIEDRAYAEGRAAGFGALQNSPHPAGSPANTAWDLGAFYSNNAAAKIQTAVD